jgi:hypothetical protein
MKCKCGEESSILQTKPFRGTTLQRRRKCVAGHTFETYEIAATPKQIARLLPRVIASKLPEDVESRRKYILARPRYSAKVLAAACQCSVDLVYKIRRESQR